MKVLVTGSSGHLGEALCRTLRSLGCEFVGIDIAPGSFTTGLGSITDRPFVKTVMTNVDTVFHTATLHKPHIGTHSRASFIETNISGTLNLLEEAASAKVKSFIYTSTTSVFGDSLVPPSDQPAAWVTEDVVPIPKNIYGVTKAAAEDVCQLFYRNNGLSCLVLRTSRFFPEEDDNAAVRDSYSADNMKTNEFLHRRADIEDIVTAHLLAAEHAPRIGFRKYIVSATTPFTRGDLFKLRADAQRVVRQRVPQYENVYAERNWRMLPTIDRVYVNDRIRNELGWKPRYDFKFCIEQLAARKDPRSSLAQAIGKKGYHVTSFNHGPYPVEGQ